MIIRKSASEIEQMERAAQVVAETLELLGEHVVPGVTTRGARRARRGVHPLARRRARRSRATAAIPPSICTSPNSMVVHGIPGPYTLRGRRRALGRRRRHARRLRRRLRVHVPRRRDLGRGAAAARHGPGGARRRHRAGPAGQPPLGHRPRVQATTEAAGFSVVRSLVGHGVGRQMHEDPQIPNFGEPGHGPVLQPGMTLAIEPMINAGGAGRLPPRRRVVDLDGGRVALRALRAHGRGDRKRPENPDEEARTQFATMTRPRGAVIPCALFAQAERYR